MFGMLSRTDQHGGCLALAIGDSRKVLRRTDLQRWATLYQVPPIHVGVDACGGLLGVDVVQAKDIDDKDSSFCLGSESAVGLLVTDPVLATTIVQALCDPGAACEGSVMAIDIVHGLGTSRSFSSRAEHDDHDAQSS